MANASVIPPSAAQTIHGLMNGFEVQTQQWFISMQAFHLVLEAGSPWQSA